MSKIALWALLMVAPLTGGCSMGYLAHLINPDADLETIEAEYKDLKGTVAVFVFAEEDVLFEYPLMRYELTSALNNQLTQNIEGLKAVPAEKIIKYQDDNLNWDGDDKVELGKAMNADYVLFISLVEFSTKEPGSVYLYRGHITAQVTLHKCSLPERQSAVWRDANMRLSFPKDEPVGALTEDDRKIRIETEREFSVMLAKKFYKHKEERK